MEEKEKKNLNYGVLANGIGREIDVANPNPSGGYGWSYDSSTKTITITNPDDYTLTGYTTENKVVVEPLYYTTVPFNIILQQVNINVSATSKTSPIAIKGGAFCRLLLYDQSYLWSGSQAAGVNVALNSTVEIDELLPDRAYHLVVYGGSSAACIGANYGESFGNITIKDIYLDLYYGYSGSGMGYANDYSHSIKSGKIHIQGGGERWIAPSPSNSNVLGSGIIGDEIEFSDGIVYAQGTKQGAILLSSTLHCNKIIRINTKAQVYAYGMDYESIGIGTGSQPSSGYTNSIVIDGGTVTAYGGREAVGIGVHRDGVLDKIEINRGIVNAYGGSKAPGIGSYHREFYGDNGKVLEIALSDQANVIAKAGDSLVYDIGDASGTNLYSELYSGMYTGLYSGELSGTYQGKLSGLFEGEIKREYTKRIACKLSGNYTGMATGRYSGLFIGKFSGYIKRSQTLS